MPFKIGQDFGATYEVRYGDELPGTAKEQFHYPPDQAVGAFAQVHVIPRHRDSWYGVFRGEFGTLSGCFSCPNEDLLAVVANGVGYIVCAEDPSRWDRVKALPIVDVVAARDAGVLLFLDFTGIIAYGRSGVMWMRDDVSSDGIRVTKVDARVIEGVAWKMGSDVSFSLDLKTGETVGEPTQK
jgi:hypothetical protein